MAAAALLVSLGVVLAVSSLTDVRWRLIPDAVLAPAALFAVAATAAAEPAVLPERLAAAAGAGGFLLAAALARPGGMGLGDVKLAAVMGLHLGPAVALALLAGLASGAIGGAGTAWRRGTPLGEATVPLAPHLAVGSAVALAALA